MPSSTQAFIGTGRPGGTPTYPSTNTGIYNALVAGYRWLVFREPEVLFTGSLNLDDAAIRQNNPGTVLRFEGAAGSLDSGDSGGRTVFKKQFGGSLIKCDTTSWSMDWSGLTFDGGAAEQVTGDYPLVDLRRIEQSRIIDCAFKNNVWDGASFGLLGTGPLAKQAHFENCQFDNHTRNCLNLDNAVWVNFHKCTFANFGSAAGDWAGIFYQGPPSSHGQYHARGLGTIEECYFANSFAKNSGIWAVRVRALDAVACVFDRARFRLDGTTAECWAYRCRYLNNATFDISSPGSTDNFNVGGTIMGVNTCLND